MQIVYHPFVGKDNAYVQISQNVIRSMGHEIIEFRGGTSTWRDIDYLILNWYDSLGDSWKNNSWIIFRRWLTLLKIKLSGVKIVYTFHNKQPHNLKCQKQVTFWMKTLCKLSDRIIILSKKSEQYLEQYCSKKQIEKKAYYIPHPNYIGVYGDKEVDTSPSKRDKFCVLFMGQVRHYKNVELVMEVAKHYCTEDIEFTIAGKPQNEEYKEQLLDMAKDIPNLHMQLRFIPDEDIPEMVSDADILLLPYDLTSSLNSGTVLLAFSYAKTVICPRIATICDFDLDLTYSYEYQDEVSHKEELIKQIDKAYLEWKDDYEAFCQKGRKLYETVLIENSPKKLAEYYEALFFS